MNTEETNLKDEKTQFNEVNVPANTLPEVTPPLPQSQKKGVWKTIAIGAGTGLVFGAGTAALTSMVLPNNEQGTPGVEPPVGPEEVITDPEISNATSVSDDMSFADAFATARAEVGPGGTFQWHGQLYNTYTAEEWSQLNPEQQDEYNNHFAIVDDDPNQPVEPAENEDDELVQVVDDPNKPEDENPVINEPEKPEEDVVVIDETGDDEEYEVEILGVVHDGDTGMNTGVMTVDDQAVIFVDVDGDEVFDLAATDVDGNGQIDDNEIIDITDQNITVDQLGGYIDNSSQLAENTDEPDYINDADIDA